MSYNFAKQGWKKCPSVYTWGKGYFWTREFNGMRQWYVWDRFVNSWVGQIEHLQRLKGE